jgi:uncharacterized membrane protein YjjB (DUF3815 family)
MEMLLEIIQDGVFAAIAAIGFGSISNPPRIAFGYIAVLAAVGHVIRFVLMGVGIHIIAASLAASLAIGLLALPLSKHVKCPPGVFSFPAMLPMIPGMYAYRTVEAMMMCLMHKEEADFNHYFYLLNYNGMTCVFIVLAMVIGATLPIFVFKRISFTATK